MDEETIEKLEEGEPQETVKGAEATLSSGEEPEAGEEERQLPEGAAWYVVHCYSGYENKVKQNLENRIESMGMQDYIFEVTVPTEEEVELHNGKRRTVEKRIFPGYILVQMVMNDDSWYVVRNTPGVTGFVGLGTKPTPLRPEEVEKIMKRMEEETPRIRVSFRVGEAVRIIDGPFTDFMGTVDEINSERGKVKVLVSFFVLFYALNPRGNFIQKA